MRRLKYATVTTPDHAVVVTTWQEPRAKGSRQYADHYRFAIDGRILDEGTLDLDDQATPRAPDHR
jgi:hypothetical protein